MRKKVRILTIIISIQHFLEVLARAIGHEDKRYSDNKEKIKIAVFIDDMFVYCEGDFKNQEHKVLLARM